MYASELFYAVVRQCSESVAVARFIYADELFKCFLSVQSSLVEGGKEMVELGLDVCGKYTRVIRSKYYLDGRITRGSLHSQPAEGMVLPYFLVLSDSQVACGQGFDNNPFAD